MLELRAYEAADADAAIDAWYAASKQAHPFLSEEFLARERQQLIDEWLPAGGTTVAVLDGDVVGFVSVIHEDRTDAEVGGIFVHPGRQGSGAGRALMDHAVSEADGTVRLEVFEANLVGRRFYDAYGFVSERTDVNAATGQPVLWLRYDAAGGTAD